MVAGEPCLSIATLSELPEATLEAVLAAHRLSWVGGLLGIATDVASALAHLHAMGLGHGTALGCTRAACPTLIAHLATRVMAHTGVR